MQGSIASKYGKRSSVRRPASFENNVSPFEFENGDSEEERIISDVDAVLAVDSIANSASLAQYSSIMAHAQISLSPSEQWSAAFSRQGMFGMLGDAQLPVVSDSSKEANDNDDEFYDDKVTQNHLRLLYLVSLYSKPADNDDDQDVWIRSHALLVLIYEGIITGVLDYDYSSCANTIGNVRLWMNVSQEGKDDLDDL
mmetsp:Transcript_26237/g.86275  ORF Transcript_26237/g.86275 Transcript_26237/m.86275 type:complete len:197 (+) Transcript_26237:53-643(+)